MTENLAMQGTTVAHGSGSTITGGVFLISSVPNVKTGVYVTPLAFSFTAGSAPGLVPGSVAGSGTVQATAVKCKAGGVLVMREGDLGTLNAVGAIPPPTGGTSPVSGPVEINSAGQDKAKGN